MYLFIFLISVTNRLCIDNRYICLLYNLWYQPLSWSAAVVPANIIHCFTIPISNIRVHPIQLYYYIKGSNFFVFIGFTFKSQHYFLYLGDPSETDMPDQRPIGDLNLLNRRPIWDRHAPSETDMPDRRKIDMPIMPNWRPTCLIEDLSKSLIIPI